MVTGRSGKPDRSQNPAYTPPHRCHHHPPRSSRPIAPYATRIGHAPKQSGSLAVTGAATIVAMAALFLTVGVAVFAVVFLFRKRQGDGT